MLLSICRTFISIPETKQECEGPYDDDGVSKNSRLALMEPNHLFGGNEYWMMSENGEQQQASPVLLALTDDVGMRMQGPRSRKLIITSVSYIIK